MCSSMIDGTVQKMISLNLEKEDWNKERRFLKDKHQLETVLGPGNVNWFEELSDRCITAMCRRRSAKHHLLEFDSPLSSPTVSQLIRNHVKVGESPPEYYHSSPAVAGKYLRNVTPQSTPDNDRHWQKPTIGLSPSPVLKDGSSFHQSSLAIASLALSHDDSTLSWTNSLATPPRLEDPGAETDEEDIQSRHKDTARALFSPKLDTTGDSMEVLESTDDEGIEELFTKHVDNDFVNPTDRNGILPEDHSLENEFHEKGNMPRDSKMLSSEVNASFRESMVLDQKSMDSWRDNFKRKLLLKSDSFGRNSSAENSPHNFKCEKKLQSPAEMFLRSVESVKNDCQDSEKVDADRKFDNLMSKSDVDGGKPKDLSFPSPNTTAQSIDCCSPVFIKQSSSTLKSRDSKSLETNQRKYYAASVVVEALSDFFDPPSGAMGDRKGLGRKRNSSEFDQSDLKHDDSLTEQSVSTAKNQVLQSILVKKRKSCGSSGKKVSFSECVLKYSDQENIGGSYSEKKRKSKKVHTAGDVDVNKNMSESKANEASIKLANHDMTEECINEHRDPTKASVNAVNKNAVADDKILIGESEDVFSQISPTALEVMCNAAHAAPEVMCNATTEITEKDKTESDVDHMSDNWGELDKELDSNRSKTGALHRSKTKALQGVQVKPKRFLYPSKQQIVVASPCEVFKYRKDETSDCKSKGIVMAIPVDRIVKKKDRDSDGKNCGTDSCKNKTFVNPETNQRTVTEVAGEHEGNHVVEQRMLENGSASYSTRLQYNSLNSHLKNTISPGFKSASGKDLNVSQDAVEKAKNLLDEDETVVTGNEMNTIACGSNFSDTLSNKISPVETASLMHSPLKLQEEDLEFSDSCENIEQADLAQDIDDIDNATNLEKTKELELDNVNEEPVRAGVSDSCHDGANTQSVSLSTERKCISDAEQNDPSYTVYEKEFVLNQRHNFDQIKEAALHRLTQEPQRNVFDCGDQIIPVVDYQEFHGFTTAGGKLLKFDEEKLKQAKTLFAVDDDSHGISQSTNSMDASKIPDNDNPYKVVSEKYDCDMSITSKSFDKVGNIVAFDNCSKFDDLPGFNPRFGGFSTASGKSCHLSTGSMIKAERLLLENKDDILVNFGEESKVETSQRESTIFQKKNSFIVNEFPKGKCDGEKSPLENEWHQNESSSPKKVNSMGNSIQSIPPITGKKSFLNLRDKSNKPKEFRPFKPPKRISASSSNRDKYPASTFKVTERTNADHHESNTDIKSCLSANQSAVYNTEIVVTDDYDHNDKVHSVNSNSQDVLKSDSSTGNCAEIEKVKIPNIDICEGFFSQMFAEDMEPEDSLCLPVPCQNVKENKENFSCVTKSDPVEKINMVVKDSSISCQEASVPRASSGMDLQPCKENSTREMQGGIAMREISKKHDGSQKTSKQIGDISNDDIERVGNRDHSALILLNLPQKNDTDVQIKCGSCKKSENTTPLINEQSPKCVGEKKIIDVGDADQGGGKVKYFSDDKISRDSRLEKINCVEEEKEIVNTAYKQLSGTCKPSEDINDGFTKTWNLDLFEIGSEKISQDVQRMAVQTRKSPLSCGFKTASGVPVNVSENVLEMTVKQLNEETTECWSDKPELQLTFMTSRSKGINVSANVLQKVEESVSEKSKLDSCDLSVNSFEKTRTRTHKQLEMGKKGNCDKEFNDLDRFSDNLDSKIEPVFKGFQTASGSMVRISETALEIAKANFSHSEDNFGKLSQNCVDNVLNTNENKSTCKSITEAESDKVVKEVETRRQTEVDENKFQGFQTAKGPTVKVSDQALHYARQQFEQSGGLHNINFEDENKFQGFLTAKGTSVKVSDQALQHARQQFEDSNEFHNITFGDENIFQGFQTAKGTSVKVSDQALQHARQQFEDSNGLHNITFEDKNKFQGFQTAKGTSVKVSDQALQHARQQLENSNGLHKKTFGDENKFQGFQTAKGSAVKVSDQALQHARQQFENSNGFHNITFGDENKFQGFQTAKGTSVKVSDQALQHARKHFEHTDSLQNVIVSTESKFPGFQTAKGTELKISDRALQYARDQLNHTDRFVGMTPGKEVQFEGLRTEIGLTVNVPEGDLIDFRDIHSISYDFESSTSCKETNFQGFQTAKGSAVKVSAKALKHAREHLDHAAKLENYTFGKVSTDQGFETANFSEENATEKAVLHSCNQQVKSNMKGQPFVDLENTEDDLQLDVEQPYKKRQKLGHHQEKGILHQSAIPGCSAKRKPQRSGPEGMTTDRRHPGFRPFIPVRSRSIGEKSSQRKEISQLVIPSKDTKSLFQTPYKKVGGHKQSDERGSEFSDLIGKMGPVFHCKRKPSEAELNTELPFQAPYKKADVQKQSDDRGSGPSDQNGIRGPVLYCKLKSGNAEVKMIPSYSDNIGNQCKEYKCDSKTLDKIENETQLIENDSKVSQNVGNIENKPSNCYRSRSVSSDHETISIEMGEIGSLSQDEEDVFYCNLVEARKKQEDLICEKKTKKIEPVSGRLYLIKTTGLADRVKLKDAVTKPGQQTEREKISVTSETAIDYRFDLTDCYGKHMDHVLLGDGAFLVPDDGGKAGKQEFYRAFLTMDGVDPKLVCDEWLNNHYRWIVWKLATYEIVCSGLCGRSLTPENVMLQLKYRYDREIDRAERSALKKIYENDDAAGKRLVLRVSGVRFMGNESDTVSTTSLRMKCAKVFVELTDGWYKIPAMLDGPLTDMFLSGKISTGQKLCITGAELIGGEGACTPLEAPETIQLKINTNSTRLAPWDSPMGYQKDPRPLCVPLLSLFDEGGSVGVIDVVIVRKYAVMYMEKLPSGGCVFRSWRDEEKVQQQYQTQRQAAMEKLYNQIQQQIEKEQRQESKLQRGCKKFNKSDIEDLSTGEEIHEAIENAAQPDMVQNYLSEKQHSLLYEYQRCIQDEKRQELNMRVQSALRDKEDEMPAERNVTPLLKFRVAGCSNKDLDCQKSTILSVWRPAAEISALKEGKRYKIYSLNSSAARSRYVGHNVQLTATKQTKFLPMDIDENLLDRIYEPREVLLVNDINKKQAPYGEFDFVGFIIKLVSAVTTDSVHSPDLMYLADCQCNILCVKFWNGFKSFGENLLTEGRCICLCNLMDKALYHNRYLTTVEATPEFTNITVKPQTSGQRHALDKLLSVMKEKVTFKEDVVSALDELLHRNQHSGTPKKFQKQKSNETTSSVTLANQELNSAHDDHHLQGCESELLQLLDQHKSNVANSEKQATKSDENVMDSEKHVINSENSLKDSISVTPSSQSRRTGAQSKIAKLSAYTTPDSLSPLPMTVSNNVSKGFKPPAFRKKLN